MQDRFISAVSAVLSHHREHARSFPWRETDDPYHILISEYMLQQTQTDRVVPKYENFLRTFPTVQSLACAPRRLVLSCWSGLGYNRRAVALHDAAKIIVSLHGCCVPDDRETLLTLPGVGPYTAGAVMVFAYNLPVPIVETNIRTVVLHHCTPKLSGVSDKRVLRFVERMLTIATEEHVLPRVFFSACMDYGAYLKRNGVRINDRSRHHTKQNRFTGSVRQARGEILRLVVGAVSGVTEKQLTALPVERTREALSGLVSDGIIEKRKSLYYLSDN